VALSHTILGALRPGVVVFDGLPNRAFLRASVEAEVPCAICLREAKKGVYEERLGPHLAHFQCVIVPHDPGDYEIPRELEARTHFVGPIVRPMTAPPRESHERPVVLITGGGGGYPGTVHFYNLALKAFAEARREDPRLDGRLVTGPLFDDWARLELVDGARVAPFDPHLTEGFAQADLVVCQCGYNTMAELERVGTRTILVPAARTLDDQFARAQRLARTYPHFSTFVGSSPQELGRLIVDAVAEGRRPPAPRPVADRGAERAAAILRAMATQREP